MLSWLFGSGKESKIDTNSSEAKKLLKELSECSSHTKAKEISKRIDGVHAEIRTGIDERTDQLVKETRDLGLAYLFLITPIMTFVSLTNFFMAVVLRSYVEVILHLLIFCILFVGTFYVWKETKRYEIHQQTKVESAI